MAEKNLIILTYKAPLLVYISKTTENMDKG